MEYTYEYLSPLGKLTMASCSEYLTGLWIEGQKYYASTLSENNTIKYLPVFQETKTWLDTYFEGKKPGFTPPLSPQGSPFRKAVWDILLKIPYGKVITYGDIAKEIALQSGRESMSNKAVGGAVGHNPISIIIPCHRVVGFDGSLTGYAGGTIIKAMLLTLEKADMKNLYFPKKGTAL